MDRSFDFGALLRNNKLKHKVKPAHIVNVAVGVQKRLESNIKLRKSVRLTSFDQGRDLGNEEPISDTQLKIDHRRAQLEKWKLEKDMKKKEEAAHKKKPFVAGVARAPLKYVPPPPISKPSTSGRVTRSQTASKSKPNRKETPQSFAPKNAGFKPDLLKNIPKMPAFPPVSRTKKKKTINTVSFEPVLYNQVAESVKQTRSKTAPKKQASTEIKPTHSEPLITRSVRGKVTKVLPKVNNTKKMVSTSSSSDNEPVKTVKRVNTPRPRKSLNESKVNKVLALQSTSSEEMSSDMESSNTQKSKRRSSIRPNYVTNLTSSSDSGSVDKSSDVITVVDSPVLAVLTPKNRVPKSESNSEEKLRSPKLPIDLLLTPEQKEMAKKISPCVTLSRGKENARKEMKWKMDEGLLDDDATDLDSIDHFRWQLDSEIKRITEICETWDKISEQSILPELVQEGVRAATGQARLLMSQKLSQFASLLERASRPLINQQPGALVTPADLHGFWDMVYMQVENVDMRFKKLEEWRARGWAEETTVPVRRKAKPVTKKTVVAAAPSRLKEMIAAARKAKKQQTEQTSEPTSTSQPEKTFEAGFFSVRSPVKSPVVGVTPRKTRKSLLQAVLSSEAKKASTTRKSASFAMLRASLLSKNVEYDGIAPLPLSPEPTPINLYATPGRSILKSATKSTQKKGGKKSIKILHFNESSDSFMSIVSDEKTEKATEYPNVVLKDLEVELEDIMASEKDKKKLLTRQNAVDSPIMTRRQRKSLLNEEVKSTKRSLRNKKTEDPTPKVESSRKTKVLQEVNLIQLETETPKQRRSKVGADNDAEKTVPKRSSRRKKSVAQDLA